MIKHLKWLNLLSLLLVFLCLLPSRVMAGGTPTDLFIRTGAVSGTFQGKDVSNGKYTSDVNLEAEVWFYTSSRQAWTIGALMATESDLGRSRYFGIYSGQRFFLQREGFIIDVKSGDDFVTMKPDWSYFVGWNAGLSQFLVVSISDVLASYTTLATFSAEAGIKRSFSPKYSMDLTFTYDYGYSISSAMSITATSWRGLLGLGYSF